jgi:hypothetical protein
MSVTRRLAGALGALAASWFLFYILGIFVNIFRDYTSFYLLKFVIYRHINRYLRRNTTIGFIAILVTGVLLANVSCITAATGITRAVKGTVPMSIISTKHRLVLATAVATGVHVWVPLQALPMPRTIFLATAVFVRLSTQVLDLLRILYRNAKYTRPTEGDALEPSAVKVSMVR